MASWSHVRAIRVRLLPRPHMCGGGVQHNHTQSTQHNLRHLEPRWDHTRGPKDPKSVLQIQTRSSSQFHRCLRHHTSLANRQRSPCLGNSICKQGSRQKLLAASELATSEHWTVGAGNGGNDVSPGSPSGTTSYRRWFQPAKSKRARVKQQSSQIQYN